MYLSEYEDGVESHTLIQLLTHDLHGKYIHHILQLIVQLLLTIALDRRDRVFAFAKLTTPIMRALRQPDDASHVCRLHQPGGASHGSPRHRPDEQQDNLLPYKYWSEHIR